jgi:purine-nucleoside phosphorylase
MRLTPLDIREQQFRRVMRGLDPEEVEQFMATVAGEFESLVASNNELRQQVVELEEKIVEYKSMEKALRDALLAAERVMGEAKESAQREAALIVREAELAADRAKGRLGQDLVRLQEEIADLRRLKDGYVSRVRWLLRSHLEMLDGHGQEFEEMDAHLLPPTPPAPRSPRPPRPRSHAEAAERPFDPQSEWHGPQVHGPIPPEWQAAPGDEFPPAGPPGDAPPDEEWSQTDRDPPGGLEDVLRPVRPDGNYGRAAGRNRPLTADEIADAARRAERLAAEARAALERHAGRAAERRLEHRDDSGPHAVRGHLRGQPRFGLILGTGLGDLAGQVEESVVVPYDEIPHFAPSTAESHAGNLVFGRLAGVDVVAMQGRVHYYEGYSMQQVTFPVRVMKALGVDSLIVTNAAGGMNPQFRAGDLVAIVDHINLMGGSPLIGPNDERLGERFPDMSQPYDRAYLELMERVALDLGLVLRRGVFVAVSGPNLETAAEYRFLRAIGADVVGMSLVPETIVAVHSGMRVLALTVVTDECFPDRLEKADVARIIRTANEAAPALSRIVVEFLRRSRPK